MSDWRVEGLHKPVKEFLAGTLFLFSLVIFFSGVFFMIIDIWATFGESNGFDVEERALVNNMLLSGVGLWIGLRIFWIDGPE